MSRARQVDLLLSGLVDNNGQPLSGGKVYTYLAGTTTPKTLYEDISLTLAYGEYLTLNSLGQAVAFADGSYKFVVKDSEDAIIATWDNLSFGFPEVSAIYCGVSTGGSNVYAVAPQPPVTEYYKGLTIQFIAHQANTDECTLSVSGLGNVELKKAAGATSLSSGDIALSQVVTAYYEPAIPCFIVDSAAVNANLNDISNLAVSDGGFIVGNGSNFVLESGATARASLGAAKSGDNSDLTSFKVTSSYRLELNEGAVGLLPNADKQINLGADSYRYKTLYTSKITDNGSKVTISSATEVGATNGFYFGDADTDYTWRIIRSGSGLIFERRESGEYKTKFSIASTGGGS